MSFKLISHQQKVFAMRNTSKVHFRQMYSKIPKKRVVFLQNAHLHLRFAVNSEYDPIY